MNPHLTTAQLENRDHRLQETQMIEVTVNLSGRLSLSLQDLHKLVGLCREDDKPAAPPTAVPAETPAGLPRLAFSIQETAEILGISIATVYRLLARGLLKSSLALGRKLIPRSEIERFLKSTM